MPETVVTDQRLSGQHPNIIMVCRVGNNAREQCSESSRFAGALVTFAITLLAQSAWLYEPLPSSNRWVAAHKLRHAIRYFCDL